MTESWIYEHNVDNSARYVLGTVGENPLVCVGVNPSTATPAKLDPTVTRIKKRAAEKGYDSWIILNLYPQRSTDPAGLHAQHLPELKVRNEQHIAELLHGRRFTLLAAWGELIETRGYLPQMLEGIVAITDDAGCDWISIGDPLKEGHPRHPSRASYALPLQSFDMGTYLGAL